MDRLSHPLTCLVLPLTLAVVGCQSAPLLHDVTVDPTAITPDRDGQADVARIGYSVGAPAFVTMTLEAADGQRYLLRAGEPRTPRVERYEALFGGVVDGRMVPDGAYTLEVSAVPRARPSATPVVETHALSVSGGDSDPAELADFTVQPRAFSPNQDGLADRVAVSYRLDEPAEVRLWLEAEDGRYVTDILEEQQSAEDAGEVGPHVYDYDAGVDADAAPPPDGRYRVIGEAVDAAGNVSRRELPLEIHDGGQPRAALIGDVEWSETLLPLGATLTFTATVANVGGTPIRTRGPEPGFVYDNDATFNQSAGASFLLLARDDGRATSGRVPADAGDVRDVALDLGRGPVDYDPTPLPHETADRDDGAPERVRVCGTVRDGDEPVGGAEVFAFEPDGDRGVRAVADGAGRFCFDALPVPAPRERSYARSSGAIRLGLEYDEKRTDLPYPYRWQLGRTAELEVCQAEQQRYLCLPPDGRVTIRGGVRFVEPPFRRSTNVYLALMHEDVRRMHGPYQPTRLTIEH